MSVKFRLRLYAGEDFVDETECLAVSMENEAYTPYMTVQAQFLAKGADYGEITEVSLYYNEGRIFIGIPDKLERCRKNGAECVTVTARSFTWVLTQNQFAPGLHYDMTIAGILEGVYRFPGVQYEEYEGSGYIYVKEGASVWDSLVNFCYKLTGHYPYVQGNTVRVTLDENPKHIVLTPEQVLETGSFRNNSRLISHFHMADPEDNYDAYSLVNETAVAAGIIRHKHMKLDRQYLSNPQQALEFRSRFCMRGCRENYVVCQGYQGGLVGNLLTCGSFLQGARICRMQMVYNQEGIRTRFSAYDDGFYHIESGA